MRTFYLMVFFLNLLTHESFANSSYCQDYLENGSFNSIYYPDLWSMDNDGKFKKDPAFLSSEDFKLHGSIEENSEKVTLIKKFIPTVPAIKTELSLDEKARIIKIWSYQVASDPKIEPLLFSTYQFHYVDGKCYPYEEWDESSGTVFNTDFCREAKPLFQAFYKKKAAQKKQKKLEKIITNASENEKDERNLNLANTLTDLFKKFEIKDKNGKSYLDTLDERAKKQSTPPDLIIIEKTLLITKICKEMDGVSQALNDQHLNLKSQWQAKK
jgi:hypothetical protein